MRVLITGIAGFVGGHLVDFLAATEPDAELYGFIRPGDPVPAGLEQRARLIVTELEEQASVDAALDRCAPERIVHLAAQASPRLSWTDPDGTMRTNVLGLLHLLEAIRRRGLTPRVLVVGSAEEYGRVAADELPVREDNALRPLSPYAVSKVAQGYVALQYTLVSSLWTVRTRTFHHTGPGRGEAFAEGSFARQIADIEDGRRPPELLVGNLDMVRDFTDVRDVVRAYWALLEKGQSGEVYNVCSGTGTRLRALVERMLALTKTKIEVRVDPARLRISDTPVLVGDARKIRSATGWEPRIPLEKTLADLIDHARRPGPVMAS
jgi:GDP-4-dehydro-6-deoxy-D-mannose reductase